jgi:hypothetical protein
MITTGTNGNRVKWLEAVATEWRLVPRETAASVVIQNQGYADLCWVVSTVMPTNLDEPCLIEPSRSKPITVRDFESAGHNIYVRAWTNTARVAFWVR